MPSDCGEITALLLQWRQGDQAAGNRLIESVYTELRRLAGHYLHGERSDHTLQPTALANELYLRIFTPEKQLHWQNRAHFFAVTAQTLRRILVDYARGRRAEKRGGDQLRVSMDVADSFIETRDEDILAIDEALHRLQALDARAAQVVELRFFSGLQEDEVAEVLAVAPITVKRDWKFARAWLITHLSRGANVDQR